METETRQNGGDPKVTSEPLVYEPGAPTSFFRDLALSTNGDQAALGRLERHARQMDVEIPKREARARVRVEESGLELRVNPNRTPGQGGNFSPPLWLIDKFATAPRPTRVLAHFMPSFPLPQGVQSVNVPRVTTPISTAASPDLSAVSSTDITDAAATSPVVAIEGQEDVSLQLLEQSPPGSYLDHALFKALSEDYEYKLEVQLINGSGANGQLSGLLSVVAASNVFTYTDASPSGPKMVLQFGQMMAAVGDNRLMPPQMWLMRTARAAWLGTAEDASGLPIAFLAPHAPVAVPEYLLDDRVPTPLFPILGLPTFPDDAIPANLGAGNNQDRIVACRPSDMLLLESEPRTMVGLEVLSGVLQARLQFRRYAAALTGRYPSGISVLQGSGMIVQAGW